MKASARTKKTAAWSTNQTKYPGTKTPLELEGVTPLARDSTFAPSIQLRTFMLANKLLIIRSQAYPNLAHK